MKTTTLIILVSTVFFFNCSTDDETVDSTNTTSSTPSTTVIPDDVDNTNPGNNFDLATLQIETSWNTSDTATVSETASTFNATDFFFMEDENMVLISKESDGKRTELKERPGEEKSLTNYKKLSYTATVENIPENGVTIAQVHNRADGVQRPLVRVYIHDDKKIEFKLTNDPDSASTYTTITGPTYQEGSVFSVTVLLQNGVASFSVETTNGSFNHTFTPSVNWTPYSNSYYLKAGVYTEGNDIQPKISFSAFELIK